MCSALGKLFDNIVVHKFNLQDIFKNSDLQYGFKLLTSIVHVLGIVDQLISNQYCGVTCLLVQPGMVVSC